MGTRYFIGLEIRVWDDSLVHRGIGRLKTGEGLDGGLDAVLRAVI